MKKLTLVTIILLFVAQIAVSQNEAPTTLSSKQKKIRYSPSIELVGGTRINYGTNGVIGIRFNNGIAFNQHLNLGLVVGADFEYYYQSGRLINDEWFNQLGLFVPLYLNLKYTILKTKWSPYISGSLGISIENALNKNPNIPKENYQTIVNGLIGLSVGAQYKFSPKRAIFFGVGYEAPTRLDLRIGMQF